MGAHRADPAGLRAAEDPVKPGTRFALVAAGGVAAAVALILATKDKSGDELRRAGAPLADSLDAYTSAHKACPATLEAIGLTSPATNYGPFVYRTWDGGKKCQITVGIYARDGFEEYWVYPPGDWYSLR
jgi:hypothetical protein